MSDRRIEDLGRRMAEMMARYSVGTGSRLSVRHADCGHELVLNNPIVLNDRTEAVKVAADQLVADIFEHEEACTHGRL